MPSSATTALKNDKELQSALDALTKAGLLFRQGRANLWRSNLVLRLFRSIGQKAAHVCGGLLPPFVVDMFWTPALQSIDRRPAE